MRKAEVAVIGGTGTNTVLEHSDQMRIGTPYGLAPPIYLGEIGKKTVVFLPRHGTHHDLPPHKVNYRANIYALHTIGVTHIIATNAVGAINPKIKPGEIVIPHDLIDFTKSRNATFYDSAPVTHVDSCEPYCPEIRSALARAAKKNGLEVCTKAVFLCTEGPRLETPAEIQMFSRLGCDVVGMTGMPETLLARELEICYAAVCFVTNMAAGMDRHLAANELVKMAKKTTPVIQQLLKEAVPLLPEKRKCQCAQALKNARFRG